MAFTPHMVLVERMDKWLHPVHWGDSNLHSVLHESCSSSATGAASAASCLLNIEYWEVPGLGKPNVADVVSRGVGRGGYNDNDMTIKDSDLDRPEVYMHANTLSRASALSSPSSSAWPDSPGTTPLPCSTTVRFRPLEARAEGKVFGPSWSTKVRASCVCPVYACMLVCLYACMLFSFT